MYFSIGAADYTAAAETRVAAATCRTRGCSIMAPVTRNAVAVLVRTGPPSSFKLTSSGPVVVVVAGWPLEKVSGGDVTQAGVAKAIVSSGRPRLVQVQSRVLCDTRLRFLVEAIRRSVRDQVERGLRGGVRSEE